MRKNVRMRRNGLGADSRGLGITRTKRRRSWKGSRAPHFFPLAQPLALSLTIHSLSVPNNSHSSIAPPAKRARTATDLAMGMDLGMGMDGGGGDRGRRR